MRGLQVKEQLIQVMNESIKLESHVADLYMIFSEAFPGDCAFWYQLHMEEKNHTSIIQSAREAWLSGREPPLELLAPNVDELIELNSKLASLLEEYKENPPSREIAFNLAVDLEESAGEAHLQNAMEQPPTSTLMELFQMLTGDDKKHASRIRTYMRDKGIKIHSQLAKSTSHKNGRH
jgi:ferritin